MYEVLKEMNKEVKVVCPTRLGDVCKFLKNFEKIETVDFTTLDFSKYDLFIALDSSTWDFASGMEKESSPGIPLVVIDHHKTNLNYGDINLVDATFASASELVYLVFQDWGIDINKDIATSLLTGILGDTGVFKFPSTTSRTLEIAGNLISLGANKDEIILNIVFTVEIDRFRFWGEVLKRMAFDDKYRFAWSAIPYEVYEPYQDIVGLKESAATLFFQSVKDSNFGVIMVEQEKGKLHVSLRSRTGLDVSKIAIELGGGGHRYAAGGGVKDLPFDQAVEKVLEICRKYAEA
jgi:phosphoesterase RecJ-like protein